jgi:O-antigen ligase
MDQLFSDGRMIDMAMAVLVVEALLLWAFARRRSALLPTLLSGLMLMIAWRATQAGMTWVWIALPLSAAGAAHGWDLWRRWPASLRA